MKIDNRYLRQRVPEVLFDKPIANQQLSLLLMQFMLRAKAVGLAANQVGYNKRVFVMNINGRHYSCFNPEIIESSSNNIQMNEGCLSFPKDRLDVARPDWIVVKYYDYLGNETQEKIDGLAARCFQHELDHLNGITMHQRQKENHDVLPKP